MTERESPGVAGVIFAQVTGRTCALVVIDGAVIAVHPPFLADGWIGKPARAVLSIEGRRWCPGVEPYRPIDDGGMRRVRRWWRDHRTAALELELTLGRTGDGGWFVHESSNALVGWRFPDFASALAECAARLMDGPWRRVPANYGPDGAVEDDPLEADLG